EETLARVHDNQVDRELVGEDLAHGFGLVLAHEAVVHVYAGEPVADGAGDERGGHGGIDTTGEAEHDLAAGTDLIADGLNGAVDERAHGPVAGASADVVGEVAQHARAFLAVGDFGVDRHSVQTALGVG